MKIHILTIVWGAPFIEVFLGYGLPSLASEGNLPSLAKEHEVVYRIYTTRPEAEVMAAHPLVRRLSSLIQVEFPDIDSPQVLEAMQVFDRMESYNYRRMNGGGMDGLRHAWKEQAGVIFVGPDNIYSDGALARVARAVRNGKRGVLLSPLAILPDGFLPALESSFPLNEAGARTLPPRELTRLGLRHCHSWMAGAFVDSAWSTVLSSLYWHVGPEGILARSWHLHPLYLNPQRCARDFFISHDNDFVSQVIDDVRELEIIQDSDEICFIDLQPADTQRFSRTVKEPFTPLRYALAAEQLFCTAENFYNVRHAVRFHGENLNQAWEDVELASDDILDRIQGWMAFLEPGSWVRPRRLDQAELREANAMFEMLQCSTQGLDAAIVWANLGKLHGAMGHCEEALRALEHELELRSQHIRAVVRLARSAATLGFRDLAERALHQASTIDPRYFELDDLRRIVQDIDVQDSSRSRSLADGIQQ
jgi:hypothetical protein